MTELADDADQLVGWGSRIVSQAIESAGIPVEYVPLGTRPSQSPDVWLVSLPYAGNMSHVKTFWAESSSDSMGRDSRKSRTTYIVGGHAVVNTWPLLDIFDAAFVGEIDSVAGQFAGAMREIDSLATVPGLHLPSQASVEFQLANDLSLRKFYRARTEDSGRGETVYLEVARGCRAGCRFCEIGWAYGQNYIERGWGETLDLMRTAGNDVVLSAPDTDGVSWFSELVSSGDYDPRWRSTRVVPYLRAKPAPKSGRRRRIRFGVEGVTERLRLLVGKKISNQQLYDAISKSQCEGYAMIRIFIIAGLPTESGADRKELRSILEMFVRARLRHWKAGEIKITGLSPQPFTPFQRCGIAGAIEAVDEYRRTRCAMERFDARWRSVLIDKHNTEADLVKQMRQGELLSYLMHRPDGSVSRASVRSIAMRAGIDYDRLLQDKSPDDVLPWAHVRHPYETRIAQGEKSAWKAINRQSV